MVSSEEGFETQLTPNLMLIPSAHGVSVPEATLWPLESEPQIPLYTSLPV